MISVGICVHSHHHRRHDLSIGDGFSRDGRFRSILGKRLDTRTNDLGFRQKPYSKAILEFISLVPSPNADFSRVNDPSVSEGLGSNKVPRDTLPQLKPNFFVL